MRSATPLRTLRQRQRMSIWSSSNGLEQVSLGLLQRSPTLPQGVLIHCMAGKDRTGLLTALLLRLAEVPISEVAADYALSAERLLTWSTPWIEGAENEEERRRRARISQTPAPAMVAVLEELERRHGGARDYLSTAGLEEGTAQRIRQRLLE